MWAFGRINSSKPAFVVYSMRSGRVADLDPTTQPIYKTLEDSAKLERKKVLADAFDVTPPTLEAIHFGVIASVSESITDLFWRDPKWVLSIEERCKYLVLGKGRGGGTGSLKAHVFFPMSKEKRDAVRLIAERWKVTVNAAGWEPKRFIVIHATSKSNVPPRVLGVKGLIISSVPHPPSFDSLLDMDPRLVSCFFDLHKETDISSLVLMFGGECELVWLNDRNDLAVFHDPTRATTALMRLGNGSVYFGAAVIIQNGETASSATGGNLWGGFGSTKEDASLKSNPWKRAVVQEPSRKGDSWGAGVWPADSQTTSSKAKTAPISSSGNRLSVLDSETAVALAASSTSSRRTDDSGKKVGAVIGHDSTFELAGEKHVTVLNGMESSNLVEDWEDACE